MGTITGTMTEANLKDAFANESEAHQRYLYFAAEADVEGRNDVSAVFRVTAEHEATHAHGHLECLEQAEDHPTDSRIGHTEANLRSAIAIEVNASTSMYPAMVKTARDEGLEQVADLFNAIAKARRLHASRLRRSLRQLTQRH